MELIPGEKYLVNVAPWGIHSVRYIGPSKWFEGYSKVQNPLTLKTFSVRTEWLRPILKVVK